LLNAVADFSVPISPCLSADREGTYNPEPSPCLSTNREGSNNKSPLLWRGQGRSEKKTKKTPKSNLQHYFSMPNINVSTNKKQHKNLSHATQLHQKLKK
jgi:hypothetical protein